MKIAFDMVNKETLMIGDWVRAKNGEPMCVLTLNPQTLALDNGKRYFFYSYEEIEPIALTPDILGQYGWEKLEWKDVKPFPGISDQWKHPDLTDTIRINFRESIHTYSIADDLLRLETVADLQHALKALTIPFIKITKPIIDKEKNEKNGTKVEEN